MEGKVFDLYRETTDDKIDRLEKKVDRNQEKLETRLDRLVDRASADMDEIKRLISQEQIKRATEVSEAKTWKQLGAWVSGMIAAVIVFVVTKALGL